MKKTTAKKTDKKTQKKTGPAPHHSMLSNAELQSLINGLSTRFENWKLETERNPNPRMVHSLKNIVSLFDTILSVTREKHAYSYKQLNHEMSRFLNSVANLHSVITESLMDDDILDEEEEITINNALMDMVKTAVDLIKIVQGSFGRGIKQLPHFEQAEK
ncbi:MAG: hypothetical protein JW904_01430 [Spirochaetales bacterium]|nr:hypothetical protein [Spirochaetales bacterium]